MGTARRSPAYVLIAISMVAAFATACQAQPQRRGVPGPKEVVIPNETVDVRMHRVGRLPTVDAMVNGKGPYRFVVDTGAAGLILKTDIANELDLPSPPGMPAGAAQVQLRSPGGPISGTLGYANTIKIGTARFNGVWTIGIDMPFGDEFDGVLGMNVFENCLLTYDYPGERLLISRGSLPEANGRDIIKYSTPNSPGSHPVVDVNVDGVAKAFMLDTGMRGWFAMQPDDLKSLNIVEGPTPGMQGLSAGGPVEKNLVRLGDSFSIGQYEVSRPIVISGLGKEPILGTGRVLGTMFLEHFVVTFDTKNLRLRLARESTSPITPPSMRTLGLGLKQKGSALEVWAVHAESHASTLGFTRGSLIHTIDGKPASEVYGTSDWFERLQSAKSVSLSFSMTSTDKPTQADVRVLDLLALDSD